jgi:transketolase
MVGKDKEEKSQEEANQAKWKEILAEMHNDSAEKSKALCKAIDKKLEAKYLATKKKHLAAMAKLEKEMAENRIKHEEKMKKYNDNTYQYMKNKWNRQFRGLDKYGNGIHPRYRKNEKKTLEKL